jgi:two-component system chemotaxis response regulator CheB
MDNRDLIVVGGSAGAVDAMRQVTRGLPADLPAAILVVIHRSLQGPSMLAQILDGEGPLPAITAEEGQPLERGHIYVAPPDRHLLLAQDHLHLRRGPRENRARPAIDPLFRSAAVCCSTRVIAVVLSGMLNDGTSGLLAVRRCGGIAVVQDPADASYADMPRSAVRHVAVDHVIAAAEMAPLLARLAASPRPPPVEAPEKIRVETLIAAQELTVMPDKGRLGSLSPLTCPECNGSMQELRDNGLIRYRCHTGHAFTLETLRMAQSEVWERTLYSAMRAQQEQAMLARRVAEEARARQEPVSAAEFERRAKDYEEGAEVIRQLLAGTAPTEEPVQDLDDAT